MNSDVDEANKLYHELHNVIRRWTSEGVRLSSYEMLGAVEAVKMDILEAMRNEENE